MKATRLGLAFAVAFALVAMACGGGGGGSSGSDAGKSSASEPAGKPVTGGTFTVAMFSDVITFDTLRLADVYSRMVLSQVAEPLFDIDKDGKVVGRLVETSESPEPNVYVWKLRKGIKFTDGSDFNAEVVRFNIERHRKDDKSVRYQDVKDISAIDVTDEYTVKITLKAPDRSFPVKFSPGGAGDMLNPKVVTALGDTLQRDLTNAGTGPFKFIEWKKDTQVVLERNPNYWQKDKDGNKLPYLDKMVFKPFPDENTRLTNVKTGDVDAIAGNPPYKDLKDLQSTTDLTVKEIPGLGISLVEFNTRREPFNNAALRRAVSYALDREQIIKTVFFGAGKNLDTAIPEGLTVWYQKEGAAHPYSKQNAAKVKEELAAGGKPNGFKFNFQISSGSPLLQQTAELMKDQLKGFGLDMEIQLLDFAKIQANGRSGDFDSLAIGWSGRVDPDGNLAVLFYTNGGSNFSGLSDSAVDKAIDEGRTSLDVSKAKTAYDQAVKLINEKQPALVYHNPPQISVVRKNIQNYPQTYNGYWGAADFYKIWKTK